MWPPWANIRSSDPAACGGQSPLIRSHSFSLSTLKDVQALLRDDSNQSFTTITSPAPSSSSSSFCRIFHGVRVASSAFRSSFDPPSPDRQIVVYFTSLGVVRKTSDDCRAVRSILRGLRVAVDERDLSMDAGFLAELRAALGPRQISLPQVFISGRYVGGADEIRRLHECGELQQLIEGAPAQSIRPCEGCGGLRFVLCGSCSESRKLYSESKGVEAGLRSCGECNHNGLVRCPDCCSSAAF